MPQIKSRKKDLRQAKARHQHNLGIKRAYKTAVRAARELGRPEAPEVAAAYKALDKAAKTRVLHPRAAARRKARLMKSIIAKR
jgi:small subunit ribosomal protein S20